MRALNIVLTLACLSRLIGPATAGPRADHWSGFDVGVGTPFPSIVGVLLGFNIADDARLSIGTGTFGPWATYALDTKFFFAPTPWAGYMGAGLSYMTGKSGTYLAWTLPFDRSFVPYIEGGVDFQSDVGVHVTFNLAAAVPSGRFMMLPGIAIGWYF